MRNFWTGTIVFLVIVASFFVQINIINENPLFGVKANIGIVFVVALSLFCGQGIGVAVGIIYGMLTDILFGKAFGIYTLLFFGVGFICGTMSRGFSKENKTALVMNITIVTVAFEFLSYLLFMFIYGYEMEIFVLIKTILLECIYNIIIARILFSFFSHLAELINRGKRSYYLL